MSDTNWDHYFPMPNERNKERLLYCVDREFSRLWLKQKIGEENHNRVVGYLKELINLFPERYLHNAYIDATRGDSLLLWSTNASRNDMMPSHSIEYNRDGITRGHKSLMLFTYFDGGNPNSTSIRLDSWYTDDPEISTEIYKSMDNFIKEVMIKIKNRYGIQ